MTSPVNSDAPIPAGFRAREEASERRRTKNTASPEVRAARGAILLQAEAEAAAKREAEQAHFRKPFEVARAVLALADDDALAVIQSNINRIDPRFLEMAAGEILAERAKARRAADLAGSQKRAARGR